MECERSHEVLPWCCCSLDLDADVPSCLPAPNGSGEAATHAVAEELSLREAARAGWPHSSSTEAMRMPSGSSSTMSTGARPSISSSRTHRARGCYCEGAVVVKAAVLSATGNNADNSEFMSSFASPSVDCRLPLP
ncbi:hypothetical protein EJB05_45642, partial [Eragrostis curvula]